MSSNPSTSPPVNVATSPGGGGNVVHEAEVKTPTRKSIDLDEAMKHFARTSSRGVDKARSGRDPWVSGSPLDS